MDIINWNEIVDLIKCKRFSEISEEAWAQVIDKITPNRRGRPKKQPLAYRDDWSLEDLDKTDKLRIAIVCKYSQLLSAGIRSKKAMQLIADNLGTNGQPDPAGPQVSMEAKNVERIVYEMQNEARNLKEMMESE